MTPYNPFLVRELMADRERQIKKLALIREIRRAQQEQKVTLSAMPRATFRWAKSRRKAVDATS